MVWNIDEDHLKIDGSKRFPNIIANKVKNFCFHFQNIKGDCNLDNRITPKIIVFNDDNLEKVLPVYAKIIKENNLVKENNKFKAVGFVGKKRDDDKLTLSNYYKDYITTKKVRKTNFDSLSGYLQSVATDIIKTHGANYYRESIIRALLKILRIAGVKKSNNRFFTERTLLKYLKENNKEFYDELNIKLVKWCLKLFNGKDICDTIEKFIRNQFAKSMKFKINTEVNNFFKKTVDGKNYKIKEIEKAPNVFRYEDIDIEVCTVHSVKGETHTATLYLETYWYKYEFERLIEHLKGISQEKLGKRAKANLKIVYVGISRPSDLLCIGIHNKRVTGHKKELKEAGWEIICI